MFIKYTDNKIINICIFTKIEFYGNFILILADSNNHYL